MALNTDREKCAHLLAQVGLGASEAEIDYYLRDGLNGAIGRLLAYQEVDEGFPVPIEQMARDGKPLNMPGLVGWWTLLPARHPPPAPGEDDLFWHDHFATSAIKVRSPLLMHAQNEILRANATGSFPASSPRQARIPPCFCGSMPRRTSRASRTRTLPAR